MYITIEISYYPLIKEYEQSIIEFINYLNQHQNINFETGIMSTVISGEYDELMDILKREIKLLMKKYPSVFTLKIANACKLKD